MNLFSLIPFPYRLIALAVMAAALLGFGWMKGAQHGEAKLEAYKAKEDAAVLAQVNKAARVSADLRVDATALEEVKDEQIAAVQHRLDAALGVLRERPERRPDDPGHPAACNGASGADLSRPDGEFLAGEAARADTIAVERNQCIAAYNEVRDALNKMKDEAAKAAR